MASQKPTQKNYMIEYICTYCGAKKLKGLNMGRPEPGACPRKGKTADGRPKPHSWRRNRTI